jgi:ribosomal 50S subunit-recycling heat shock protein
MRIDLFLKKTRIVKTRTKSKNLCEKGMVLVNGLRSKPGKGVKVQDKIRIDFGGRILEIVILEIPKRNVQKKDGPSYYRILKDQKVDIL